jgi:hypothetical protein
MALKFGREMRTPAIQAGLTTRRLTLTEIFPSAMLLWFSEKVKFGESTVLGANASGGIATIDDGSTARWTIRSSRYPSC